MKLLPYLFYLPLLTPSRVSKFLPTSVGFCPFDKGTMTLSVSSSSDPSLPQPNLGYRQ